MAVLSNNSIVREIQANRLVIDPFQPEALQPASYDMGLHWKLLISPTRHERGRIVDLREEINHQFAIEPGRFVGILTDEIFKLPLNIAGRFGLRSEYTRQGLVSFGGIQIDPGFHGRLAISLFHAGPEPLVVEHKRRMFTVEFQYLDVEASEPYEGDFQGQLDFPHVQEEFILNANTFSLAEIATIPREIESLEFRFAQLESARPSMSFDDLALLQGIEPIMNIDEFAGIWPEDEDPSDFLAHLARWRSEVDKGAAE